MCCGAHGRNGFILQLIDKSKQLQYDSLTKMATRYCSVHNCSKNNLSPGVSFHKIRPEWVDFVRQQRKGGWEPKPNSKICSVHFTPQQINNRNHVRAGEMPSLVRRAINNNSNISSGIL